MPAEQPHQLASGIARSSQNSNFQLKNLLNEKTSRKGREARDTTFIG
jgi:hypothetical protein